MKVLPNPNDALALALLDIKSRSPGDRPFTRYVWVDSGEAEDAKAVSLVLNQFGRGTLILRPEPIGRDKLILLRVDLRAYGPRQRDLEDLLYIWEEFQFDPRFNQLLTKGALKAVLEQRPEAKGRGAVCRWNDVKVKRSPYTWKGQTYDWVWGRKRVTKVETFTFGDLLKELKDIELIRFPSPALDLKQRAELEELTGSEAPLVAAPYFLYRATSTIKDKGVYAVIYGGLYYELAGIPRSKDQKKATDEDLLFEELGVGNVKGGLTAKKVFERLRSDMKVGMFRSQVSGSARQVDMFPILVGRLDQSSRFASVTHDLQAEDIDIDVHPVANLLDFKDAAREVIYTRPNGLHGYVLFNGEGKLQEAAPSKVVRDFSIPSPHRNDLQGSIGCISCHESGWQWPKSDGWISATNDVKKMLGRRGDLDVFGDVGRRNDAIADTLDRIAGLYQGDFERPFMRGRDDYSAAVLRATGPWKESKGQTDVVKFAATRVVKVWRDYWYKMVTPHSALAQLGVDCNEKDATDLFAKLVGPDTRAAVPVAEVGDVIIPEDPRIGALRMGIPVSRQDFDLTYAFIAERARFSLAKLQKAGKN